MKALILALITLGLCAPARSASLTTVDGVTYNHITTQRVDPDGLFIEYTLPDGGLGMAKVKFSRLSAEQQKQFGYDPKKAQEYELGVAKATEAFRQEALRMDQIAQAARQARDAQNDRAAYERFVALSQANAMQAPPYDNGAGYGWYGGGGIGLIALPQTGRVPPARTQYAPVVTPIPYPRLNVPTRPAH